MATSAWPSHACDSTLHHLSTSDQSLVTATGIYRRQMYGLLERLERLERLFKNLQSQIPR